MPPWGCTCAVLSDLTDRPKLFLKNKPRTNSAPSLTGPFRIVGERWPHPTPTACYSPGRPIPSRSRSQGLVGWIGIACSCDTGHSQSPLARRAPAKDYLNEGWRQMGGKGANPACELRFLASWPMRGLQRSSTCLGRYLVYTH